MISIDHGCLNKVLYTNFTLSSTLKKPSPLLLLIHSKNYTIKFHSHKLSSQYLIFSKTKKNVSHFLSPKTSTLNPIHPWQFHLKILSPPFIFNPLSLLHTTSINNHIFPNNQSYEINAR